MPLPFTVFYAAEVKDAGYVEKQIARAFKDKDLNPKQVEKAVTHSVAKILANGGVKVGRSYSIENEG